VFYGEYLNTYCQSVALVWNLDTDNRSSRVARYISKGIAHPVASIKWALSLSETSEHHLWFRSNPRLLLKPGRHYISRHYNFASRTKIISNHYAALSSLLSRQSFEALAQGTQLLLANFVGKKGGNYQITLSKTDKFDREGELILGLKDADRNGDIFWFVFSLNHHENQTWAEIGCFQGAKGEDARAMIKLATKEFHGIRPRNLLADAMYALAANWGLSGIFGISNSSRVYNGSETFADYDTFWQELGGTPDRDGLFRLPVSLSHHPLCDIPSQHRAEYRRRMELRDALGQQIDWAGKRYSSANGNLH